MHLKKIEKFAMKEVKEDHRKSGRSRYDKVFSDVNYC